jgi:ribosomal-protein-alanine N-acetyltransferase
VLKYAFDELKLNRVHARHFKRNPASGRVMQKVGMKHEGCLRQHFKKWGNYEDSEMYGILRKEFDDS